MAKNSKIGLWVGEMIMDNKWLAAEVMFNDGRSKINFPISRQKPWTICL